MLPPKNTKKGPAKSAPLPDEIDATRALVEEVLRSSMARFDEIARTAPPTDAVGALLIAEAIHLQTWTLDNAAKRIDGAIRDQTLVLREHAAHLSRYEGLLTSIAADQRRILEKGVKR